MNSSPASAGSSGGKTDARWWPWALLATLVCFAAVTRQSLWIDEALTAAKASASSFFGWWQVMQAERSSDLQMPLYMLYVWGFAKIFGTSEWALRIANLPWFVAGVSVFITAVEAHCGTAARPTKNPIPSPHDEGAGREEISLVGSPMPSSPSPQPSRRASLRGEGEDWRRKMALAFVALMSPFAWYYLDEARPYAMQLGASLIVCAALFRLRQNEGLPPEQEQRWAAVFFFGVLFLCGSSLLGMIWAGAAILSLPVIFSWRRLGELLRANELVCATLGVSLMAAAVYYLWTMKLGARASAVGGTDARNLAFIAYELLGFSGLGPGRLEIREGGLNAFRPFAAALVLYGIAVSGVAIFGLRQLWRNVPRNILIGLAMAMAVPLVAILAAGFVMHFRVLGRHCTPLLIVVLVVLWQGMDALLSRSRLMAKGFAAAFVILSLMSCYSIRFAARHQKDDYRGAARLAKEALEAGQSVWWNAGREGALYYNVPLVDTPRGKGPALWVMNPTVQTVATLPTPDIIITSKPDVYDGRGGIETYLRQGHYLKHAVLQAFIVWERPGDLAESGSNLQEATMAANLIE